MFSRAVQCALRFLGSEEAATAVEYAVLLVLIVGGCITGIQLVGGGSGAFWSSNVDSIENAFENTSP